MKRVLTPEMEAYFIKNALLESEKKMAVKFGVSNSVVKTVFKNNNIQVPKEVWFKFRIDAMTGRTTFSKQEDQFIKDNYLQIPVKTIASILNRSGCGITGRLKALNLFIPKEIAEKRKESGMYRKGQVPPNKGKKQIEYMTAEAIEKTKATRFKKGQISHNALPEGSEVERIDKRKGTIYLMIKVPGNKKLIYKHIYYWQQVNGKLKTGMNVVFKDGNTKNCVIENLEFISDAELMQRNTLHRFPKEITDLIHIKAAVTRQINKHKKLENESI